MQFWYVDNLRFYARLFVFPVYFFWNKLFHHLSSSPICGHLNLTLLSCMVWHRQNSWYCTSFYLSLFGEHGSGGCVWSSTVWLYSHIVTILELDSTTSDFYDQTASRYYRQQKYITIKLSSVQDAHCQHTSRKSTPTLYLLLSNFIYLFSRSAVLCSFTKPSLLSSPLSFHLRKIKGSISRSMTGWCKSLGGK